MGLLDPYFDPGLDVDLALSAQDVSSQEVERLQNVLAIARVAAGFPRRLSDASRDELALDKKRSRRVAHVYSQLLTSWGGKEREPTDEERSAGAQVDWELLLEGQRPRLTGQLRYVATWAKLTGNLRFGKSAVIRLEQELDWLTYAMRD